MYNLRTRFKSDIVCEFLSPKKDTGKVIIICGGMPSYTSNKDLVEFFSKKVFGHLCQDIEEHGKVVENF